TFCAITSKKIYGPFYFEDDKGNAVTVNKENNRYMLEHSVIPTIGNVDEMWYQQDGALPHIAHETGYLKDRVYRNKPETIEDLKENVETEIADILRSMLKRVMNSFYDRVQQCRQREGRLLDGVIFHS
uniref:Uncharacterized protein n=1 Tax=Strongyloides stercoralis TaxID=6248 RepID=A0AAF5DN97_STRER